MSSNGNESTGNLSVDMATALELPLGLENEMKFIALRNLHLRKIKQLMSSVDLKDKEIAKLKVTTKDNRRTQMIQALRNKIKELELINDMLKEELSVKAEWTAPQVNDFIMKKTLGGPKRFRPLSREEMENKIYELERKLSKKTSTPSTNPKDNDMPSLESDAKKGRDSNLAQSKTTPVTRNRPDDSKGGSSSDSGGTGLVDAAALLEEVERLRAELRSRDAVADKQRDEISRLRSRNSELVAAEEENVLLEKQISSLEDVNSSLNSAVEDLTAQLAEALEVATKYRMEGSLSAENDRKEVLTLQSECERLLKQNTALLQSLSEAEAALQRYEEEQAQLKERGDSAESLSASKDAKMKALEQRLQRAEEKLKQSESKCTALETEIAQVATLKDQLREKNIQLKELKRNMEERERQMRLRAASKPDTAESREQKEIVGEAIASDVKDEK
eukprot:gene2161-2359_t